MQREFVFSLRSAVFRSEMLIEFWAFFALSRMHHLFLNHVNCCFETFCVNIRAPLSRSAIFIRIIHYCWFVILASGISIVVPGPTPTHPSSNNFLLIFTENILSPDAGGTRGRSTHPRAPHRSCGPCFSKRRTPRCGRGDGVASSTMGHFKSDLIQASFQGRKPPPQGGGRGWVPWDPLSRGTSGPGWVGVGWNPTLGVFWRNNYTLVSVSLTNNVRQHRHAKDNLFEEFRAC